MFEAFVMIRCDAGKEDSIISNLRQISGVQHACGTFGTYDIMATLLSDSQIRLENIISKQIRNLDHVRGTFTVFTDHSRNSFGKSLTPEEKETLEAHTAQAYVLIECDTRKEGNIVNTLREIPEIIEGFLVVGTYDLIVKVVAPSYNEISDIVTKKIRQTHGIKKTLTLNIITEQGAIKKIAA